MEFSIEFTKKKQQQQHKRISQTIILYTFDGQTARLHRRRAVQGDKNAFNFSREILSRFVNRILCSCHLSLRALSSSSLRSLRVFGEVHKFSLNWLIIFNSNIIIFCCLLLLPLHFVPFQLAFNTSSCIHQREREKELKKRELCSGRSRSITI